MQQPKITFRDIAKMSEVMRNPVYRIIMEKDRQNLTYEGLEMAVRDNGCNAYNADYIRKSVEAKELNEALLSELHKVLGIEPDNENLSETVATYRYNKERKVSPGRISKTEKSNRKQSYDKIHEQLKDNDGVVTEGIIMQTLTERFSYNGFECDRDIYEEFMEEDLKKYILKKILVIYDLFPEEVEEFIKRFAFDDDDNKEFEYIDVDIKYKPRNDIEQAK